LHKSQNVASSVPNPLPPADNGHGLIQLTILPARAGSVQDSMIQPNVTVGATGMPGDARPVQDNTSHVMQPHVSAGATGMPSEDHDIDHINHVIQSSIPQARATTPREHESNTPSMGTTTMPQADNIELSDTHPKSWVSPPPY